MTRSAPRCHCWSVANRRNHLSQPVVPGLPHLVQAEHEDIPLLADLLGLREHAPQQPTG